MVTRRWAAAAWAAWTSKSAKPLVVDEWKSPGLGRGFFATLEVFIPICVADMTHVHDLVSLYIDAYSVVRVGSGPATAIFSI